ncbi:MAG TPA: porin family protein [Puia sp.]|nr:porin family protein [Puia sp.]
MRNFIPTLLVVIGLTQAGTTIAQSPWLGFHGGLSIPDLSGGGGNAISSNYTSRLAANFGIQADYGITQKFSIDVELNYAGQGGKRDGLQPVTNLPSQYQTLVPPGDYLYGNFKNTAAFDYLELPILARLKWGKAFKFYVNAGPYFGLLLHAEEKTRGSSYIYEDPQGNQPISPSPVDFTSNTDVTSDLHKFNFGVTGGIGISQSLGSRCLVFLDGRFEYGLLNIQKYSEDGKNNTGNVLVSLGYSRRIGR